MKRPRDHVTWWTPERESGWREEINGAKALGVDLTGARLSMHASWCGSLLQKTCRCRPVVLRLGAVA